MITAMVAHTYNDISCMARIIWGIYSYKAFGKEEVSEWTNIIIMINCCVHESNIRMVSLVQCLSAYKT